MAAAVAMPAAALSCFDVRYEFCAPKFFDFCVDESEEQIRAVEKWFDEPSPRFISTKVNSQDQIVDKDEQLKLKLLIRLDNQTRADSAAIGPDASSGLDEIDDRSTSKKIEFAVATDPDCNEIPASVQASVTADLPAKRLREQSVPRKQLKRNTHDSKKKKMMIPKQQQQPASTPQANSCKRRKLDAGQKQAQLHKYTPAATVPRAFQLSTDKRAEMHKKCGTVSKAREFCSFVSLAEQVQHFCIKTPERYHNKAPTLTLSRPKEPELETSHRSRPIRVKSSAEIEEQILHEMPKFKARPVNKKILEAPSLPALPRSNPEKPRFEEFKLRTNERALHHTSQHCVEQPLNIKTKDTKQRRESAPGDGPIRISIRDRPRAKITKELLQDASAVIPRFKALPLNKKIFESRGDLGVYQKRQVTVPKEFKFATRERCHAHNFRRLSLDSHPRPLRSKSKAEPFHLLTEERGSLKMEKFTQEQSKAMVSETSLRIPKANLLPLTTDFPAVPPKPIQKPCTKPEPFRLESLMRHEQEIQRQAEERAREQNIRADQSRFRAQPISSSGSIFVPERSRKPLTEVKEFNLKADCRAIDRAAFEKKIIEKQALYRHLKQELELARQEEEEKFVKALRSEMIPVARPLPLFDKPFFAQRSTKSLTIPVSPQFSLPRRDRGDGVGPFTYRKFRMR